jgi:hypothetical protein
MGSFFTSLSPVYGLHPVDDKPYWPNEQNGFKTYEENTRMWLEAADEEASLELSKNKDVKDMEKHIGYLLGDQWTTKRPTYRAAPVDNKIWSLMWELISLLTDIRPIFEIESSDKENRNFQQAGRMLSKATKSWWLESDADMSLALVIIYAMLVTGYAKLCWNPDIRNGEGDFELVPIGPKDLRPLKAKHSLQSAQALIYESPQTIGWIRNKFPLRGHLVKPDPKLSSYHIPSSGGQDFPFVNWNNIGPAMQRMMGRPDRIGVSTYPMARYREFWIKDSSYNTSSRTVVMGAPTKSGVFPNFSYTVAPGHMLYPRGRLICMGGDVVLHDGPNPYWHGQFPFESLRLNIVPWQFLGVSEFRPLVPQQDVVNNILAGVIEMIKLAVNPGIIGPKNAFTDAEWASFDPSMPGFRAAYSQSAGEKPEFSKAPQIPSYVMQTLGYVIRSMDRTSGLAAVSDALQKKQVPSGETLEEIKETKQTPMRLKGRNIEVFLRNLGRQNIFNVLEFYTDTRKMFITGDLSRASESFYWDPRNLSVPERLTKEEFAKNFAFVIQPGTLLNVNRLEHVTNVMRLRAMKDIDRKTMLEVLEMGLDPNRIEERLKEEAMVQASTMADQKALLMLKEMMAQGAMAQTGMGMMFQKMMAAGGAAGGGAPAGQ